MTELLSSAILISVILIIVSLIIGFIIGRRTVKSPPINVLLPKVELGVTRIDEVYGREGSSRPLIGFIDSGDSKVYVSEKASYRVKKLFHVKEDKGDSWVLDHPRAKGEYKVTSLDSLDFRLPIQSGALFALQNHYCVDWATWCVNFYDITNGYFLFSAKQTITGHYRICYSGGSGCVETWKRDQFEVFDKSDCKGSFRLEDKTIAVC